MCIAMLSRVRLACLLLLLLRLPHTKQNALPTFLDPSLTEYSLLPNGQTIRGTPAPSSTTAHNSSPNPRTFSVNEDTAFTLGQYLRLAITRPRAVSAAGSDSAGVEVGAEMTEVAMHSPGGSFAVAMHAAANGSSAHYTTFSANGSTVLASIAADINTLLSAVTFTPTPNLNGPTSITITATMWDAGSNPNPSAETTYTFPLIVMAVNDPPVISLLSDPRLSLLLPQPLTLNETQPQPVTTAPNATTLSVPPFSPTPLTFIKITDPDVLETPFGYITLTLTCTTGTLRFSQSYTDFVASGGTYEGVVDATPADTTSSSSGSSSSATPATPSTPDSNPNHPPTRRTLILLGTDISLSAFLASGLVLYTGLADTTDALTVTADDLGACVCLFID